MPRKKRVKRSDKDDSNSKPADGRGGFGAGINDDLAPEPEAESELNEDTEETADDSPEEAANEEAAEVEEAPPKPRPKRKAKRRPKRKEPVEEVAEDTLADPTVAEETTIFDDDTADESEPKSEAAEPEPEPEPEEPEIPEEELLPDNVDAINELKHLGCRLDQDERQRIWRVFFYDRRGNDESVKLLAGLPCLKEVWLLGTKVSPDAAKQLREDRPKLKVYI